MRNKIVKVGRMGMGKCNNEQFHNFREIKAIRMIGRDVQYAWMS